MEAKTSSPIAFNIIVELPLELSILVFSFLTVAEQSYACATCKQWNLIANDVGLWKQRALTETEDETRFVPDIKFVSKFSQIWKKLFQELGGIFDAPRTINVLDIALEASSTDDNSQVLSHTLSSNHKFWSSCGSEDPDSNEFIVYGLFQPICIVKDVSVTVYRALYQHGMPLYPPKSLRISIGFSDKPEEMHYVSPVMTVAATDEPQKFEIVPPQVGGFIRIDLLGRVQTQPSEDRFYTVIQHVKATGVPVGALPDRPLLLNALVDYALASPAFVASMDQMSTEGPLLRDQEPAAQRSKINRLLHEWHQINVGIRENADLAQNTRKQIAGLVDQGKYGEAAHLVVVSKKELGLRDVQTLELFANAPQASGEEPPIQIYLYALVAAPGKLRECESLELTRYCLVSGKRSVLQNAILDEKMRYTLQMGDLLFEAKDYAIAANVYMLARVPDKVVDCLLRLGQFWKLVQFMAHFEYLPQFVPTWATLLVRAKAEISYQQACGLALVLMHGSTPLVDDDTVREVLGLSTVSHQDLIRQVASLAHANPHGAAGQNVP